MNELDLTGGKGTLCQIRDGAVRGALHVVSNVLERALESVKENWRKERSEFAVHRQNSVAYLMGNHQDFPSYMPVPPFSPIFLLRILSKWSDI